MTKFSLKKKLLPSLMAASLASGVAFSGNANAIELAENGVGQVLLGPMYLADFGYQTRVRIVNTRTNTAVKAKVVLRSAVNSVEVLDFICYMSPSDVCTFVIRQNKNGNVELYSNDDSVKSPVSSGDLLPDGSPIPLVSSEDTAVATFASIRPVTQPLFTQFVGTEDTVKMGHIEIVGAYGVQGNINVNTNNKQPIAIVETMSKFLLAQIFDTPRFNSGRGLDEIQQITNNNNQQVAVQNELAERRTVPTPYGPLVNSRIRSTDPTWVQLMGNVEIESANDHMGYRLPALAGAIGNNANETATPDFNTDQINDFIVIPGLSNVDVAAFSVTAAAVADGLVISNPRFDVHNGQETGIGENFGINGSAGATPRDKTVEIEQALAATNISGLYVDDSNSEPQGINRTRIAITFPTRYRHSERPDPDDNFIPNNPCNNRGIDRFNHFSPPFDAIGRTIFNLTSWDNQEGGSGLGGNVFSGGVGSVNSLVEVNYFIPEWPATKKNADGTVLRGTRNFESGWFRMNLTPRAGCPYEGSPVLAFTHRYMEMNGKLMNSWFVPVTHN